jgi:hypothetical protein
VFDNRMGRPRNFNGTSYLTEPQEFGYSGTLALDPVTRETMWRYYGSPEAPFNSTIQGSLKELPNGNILATEAEGGRIFEVDRETREIVWEYRNVIEEGYVGRVTQAIPVPDGWFEAATTGN